MGTTDPVASSKSQNFPALTQVRTDPGTLSSSSHIVGAASGWSEQLRPDILQT